MSEIGEPLPTVVGQGGETDAVMRAIDPAIMAADARRVDYANMPTEQLIAAYWTFVRNPLSDIAIALANAKIAGQHVPSNLGDIGPHVETALGLRKAHGRNITTATVEAELNLSIPAGFTPSFTLYLQAARIKPDDMAERKTINDIKNAIRKRIRAIRK